MATLPQGSTVRGGELETVMAAMGGTPLGYPFTARGFSPAIQEQTFASNTLAWHIPRGRADGPTGYPSSTDQRESYVYGNEILILPRERSYLDWREPVAELAHRRIPNDTWLGVPRTFDPAVDDFLAAMEEYGGIAALRDGDCMQCAWGVSFVIVNTGTPMESPLRQNDTPFFFEAVPSYLVRWDPMTPAAESATVAIGPWQRLHGIPFIEVLRGGGATGMPTRWERIHGSRILWLKEDSTTPGLIGVPVIDGCYDSLRNMRDIEYITRRSQMQGNPIVLDVDVEAGFRRDENTEAQVQQTALAAQNDGMDFFGSIEGYKMRRLGATDLDDPTHAIRLSAGKVALRLRVPFSFVYPQAANEKSADAENAFYESAIANRRTRWARTLLVQLVAMGRFFGMLEADKRLPLKLEWDPVYPPSPKDQAYIDRGDVDILRGALSSGYLPKGSRMEKFEKNTVPVDVDLLLPTVSEKLGGPEGGVGETGGKDTPPSRAKEKETGNDG